MNRSDSSLDVDGTRDTKATEFRRNDSGIKAGVSFPTSTQSNTSIQTFGSLADLTAHHLKKSSSSGGISSPVVGSPNAGFVIPRIWPRDESLASSPKLQFGDIVEKRPRRDLDDDSSSLNSDFNDMRVSSRDDVQEVRKNQSDSFKNTRTPSPEDWVIDLSSALSETFSKVVSTNEKSISKLSEDLTQDISRLDIYLNTNVPAIMEADSSSNLYFDCNLNLSGLEQIKLPYSKEVVSLFGKILCRKWKTRKPYVRTEAEIDVVKRFDFSNPSPDDRILVHLRKRL